MGGLNGYYKPVVAMVCMQFIYTGLAIFTRAALLEGMSPRVFVVYRQAIATLIIAPFSFYSRWRNPNKVSLGLRSFSLIFVTSLIGVTANQNAYFEGLYLSNSTITTAMTNLLPAITFVMAAMLGMEKIDVQSFRSIAKIIGTIFCVGGAICMALVKGPKLLNTEVLPLKSLLFRTETENFQLGCLILFAMSCFWSFWLIMQVSISTSCPDHLYSTLWMCFLSTIQSSIFTFLVDDLQVWNLNSFLQLGSCLYGGIGTGVTFFVQVWCISQRGPLFAAMFSPLCTVITTIIAACFLHEKLYIGSLLGAIGVIVGLYIVLWGKAKELEEITQDRDPRKNTHVLINESSEKTNHKIDLEEPLLLDKSNYENDDESRMNIN
ncbi:hypothetical protein UlMin_046243 [Ulmus minor]